MPLAAQSITMTPTQSFPLPVTQVDENNNPLTTQDPSYGGPSYVISDPTILSFQTIGINPTPVAIIPTGKLGTATVTASETSSASEPGIQGVLNVTIVGPAAAGLKFTGSVQGS